ncbi:MAG: hypothetical protein M0R17_10350 [Candidatus Omnitrophica bacterium]|jgi:hypothetical protein|nr:hypothetical protein [Candidatus Omnitrophota bacterium]
MPDNTINQLLTESGELYKNQFNQTKKLAARWAKTGLLKGLDKEIDRNNMALMLENQARELLKEISDTGTGGSKEEWSGVALPLVRRIFAEIAAKDFVSVQPMSLPSGLVFYLDLKYGTNQPYGFQGVGESSTDWQYNSIYGTTKGTGSVPYGGLYGAGRFGYSINDYTASITSALCTTGSVNLSDINYNPYLSASVADGTIKYLQVDMSNTGYDPLGIRAFAVTSGSSLVFLPEYTTVNTSQSLVKFLCTGLATSASFTVYYHKQTTATNRADFEARGEYNTNSGYDSTQVLEIPELTLNISSEPIVAKTRKLKAVWSPEYAQDLNAYHSIDAEEQLTSILSEYISMEIDLEILDMLITSATTVDYWSAKIGTIKTGTAGTMADFQLQDASLGYSLHYTQPTWFQTLGVKMQKVSNIIHQKTMRGGANFAVCSPTIATVIESMNGFTSTVTGTSDYEFAMGVEKIGTLQNKWNVYKNPYMTGYTILMGFRGKQFLETGAVFAPYIPLIMTPTIYDPTNLVPRKGISTRYAKRMLRPEYFGKIRVTDVNFI